MESNQPAPKKTQFNKVGISGHLLDEPKLCTGKKSQKQFYVLVIPVDSVYPDQKYEPLNVEIYNKFEMQKIVDRDLKKGDYIQIKNSKLQFRRYNSAGNKDQGQEQENGTE